MPTWNTDAQLADSIDERFLATNPQIDNFLSDGVHGKFLLVAAKGMGKTLLLRHKRKQIEQTRKDYFLVPRNATADYVNLPASPSKGLIKLMQAKQFWEDIWTISIAISVLLNFPHELSEAERDSALNEIKRADIPSELAQEMVSAFSKRFTLQRSPSSVLNIFLQSPGKAIEKARSRGLQVVTELFNKYISSGCAVFIDSFDHAIGKVFPDNLDIWCNGQLGLLKAAWELSRHNRHVKIYATIRQEAFAYFDDPEINNIKGSMLLIEYSKDDLEAIFAKAIDHYEGITDPNKHILEDAFLPCRNLMFLTVGAAYAFQCGASTLGIGLLDEAYHLFPDQTRNFLTDTEALLSQSLGKPIKLVAPLMSFSKADVLEIAKARSINGTYSCHAGTEKPCGVCIACREYIGLEI